MNLREAVTAATARLARNEYLQPTAARDAELLLLHTLQLPRSSLFSDPTRPLTSAELSSFESDIARRLTLEPIQYITGTQEFYGLLLRVTPAVFIPRPETELLVEAVLARLPTNIEVHVADVGTGSGAIAIAIAHHLPHARVTALDISPEALNLARSNAEDHHVAERIHFRQSDLLTVVAGERFDAILSNPPYIPIYDRATLHPQVRDHEPPAALFAGPAGLDIYTRLIPQAHAALRPGGLLALELGHGQSVAIRSLLADWGNVLLLDDLQQIPRVALASRC